MIIKVIGVKNKAGAIGKVVRYIANDKGRIADYKNQGLFHNLIHTDLADIQRAFEQNYEDYAVKRVNGNIGAHVILSVSPLDRDKVNLDIMDDLVQTYLNKAFPDAIAFAAHHKEQAHWHSHILLSANKIMSKEGTRLSKADLKEIQHYMLEHIKEKHPQLSTGINMKDWGKKLGKSDRQYYKEKRNPGMQLSKEQLTGQVREIFRSSVSTKDFYSRLEKAGYTTYLYKDEVKGIFWKDGEKDKKMRFNRLGIKDEVRKTLDQQHDRLAELEKLRGNYTARTVQVDRPVTSPASHHTEAPASSTETVQAGRPARDVQQDEPTIDMDHDV